MLKTLHMCNNIVVVGGSGSGKSTLARKIGEATNLPTIHLDLLYWKPNWTRSNDHLFNKEVRKITNIGNCVIEGNYAHTLEYRIKLADIIFVLDIPVYERLWGVITRWWRFHGTDIFPGCPDEFNLRLLKAVFRYKNADGKLIENILARYPEKKVVRLKSRKESREYMLFLENTTQRENMQPQSP